MGRNPVSGAPGDWVNSLRLPGRVRKIPWETQFRCIFWRAETSKLCFVFFIFKSEVAGDRRKVRVSVCPWSYAVLVDSKILCVHQNRNLKPLFCVLQKKIFVFICVHHFFMFTCVVHQFFWGSFVFAQKLFCVHQHFCEHTECPWSHNESCYTKIIHQSGSTAFSILFEAEIVGSNSYFFTFFLHLAFQIGPTLNQVSFFHPFFASVVKGKADYCVPIVSNKDLLRVGHPR